MNRLTMLGGRSLALVALIGAAALTACSSQEGGSQASSTRAFGGTVDGFAWEYESARFSGGDTILFSGADERGNGVTLYLFMFSHGENASEGYTYDSYVAEGFTQPHIHVHWTNSQDERQVDARTSNYELFVRLQPASNGEQQGTARLTMSEPDVRLEGSFTIRPN